jgi:hypothetical protein
VFAVHVVLRLTHSFLFLGVLGGTVHEAMTDLVQLMASLVDSQGKILVQSIMDDVVPVTPEEEALYEQIEFNLEEYKVRFTALLCSMYIKI